MGTFVGVTHVVAINTPPMEGPDVEVREPEKASAMSTSNSVETPPPSVLGENAMSPPNLNGDGDLPGFDLPPGSTNPDFLKLSVPVENGPDEENVTSVLENGMAENHGTVKDAENVDSNQDQSKEDTVNTEVQEIVDDAKKKSENAEGSGNEDSAKTENRTPISVEVTSVLSLGDDESSTPAESVTRRESPEIVALEDDEMEKSEPSTKRRKLSQESKPIGGIRIRSLGTEGASDEPTEVTKSSDSAERPRRKAAIRADSSIKTGRRGGYAGEDVGARWNEKYQEKFYASCSQCRRKVDPQALGKYCVRFGSEVHQFCVGKCLEDFKRSLKLCAYCQRDIQNSPGSFVAPVVTERGTTFKDFCRRQCLEKYEEINLKKPPVVKDVACRVCGEVKPAKMQFVLDEESRDDFCSEFCLKAYLFSNKHTSVIRCRACQADFSSTCPSQKSLCRNGKVEMHCSQVCANVAVLNTRGIVSCHNCKVRKYNYDMLEEDISGSFNRSQYYCSAACLRYSMNKRPMPIIQTPTTKGNQATKIVLASPNEISGNIQCTHCRQSKLHYCTLVTGAGPSYKFCRIACAKRFEEELKKTGTVSGTPTALGKATPPVESTPSVSVSTYVARTPPTASVGSRPTPVASKSEAQSAYFVPLTPKKVTNKGVMVNMRRTSIVSCGVNTDLAQSSLATKATATETKGTQTPAAEPDSGDLKDDDFTKILFSRNSGRPERLDSRQHFVAMKTTKVGAPCVVCSSTGIPKDTVYYCETCSDLPHLHVLCFRKYHTLQDFRAPASKSNPIVRVVGKTTPQLVTLE
ncbi:unnamed protein product [Cyprideis torosa]|uniref:Uncharacterized protein n=1 Tax=Cyprideis torosa TaxID=163714 RepID=A0A7R8W5P8_9CRUS|nr:unnamed protein product [Cyprideis torosa]CAG0885447.1 unnamed protein product [Cyprideis torosa]